MVAASDGRRQWSNNQWIATAVARTDGMYQWLNQWIASNTRLVDGRKAMVEPVDPTFVEPAPGRKPAAREVPAWEDAERSQGGVGRELRRLARRARRRPWLTLLLTLLITGAAVAKRSRKPRIYESRIAFRVTEGDLDAETAPRTVGSLRHYVAAVCFSTQRLAGVIRAHNLYPTVMKRDEGLAVEEMRDDIDVEVWRNFFSRPRYDDDGGRSARMAITYSGKDRQVVYDVVRDLARLITEEEETSRIAQAEGALNDAEDRVRESRSFSAQKHHDLVVKQVALANARNQEQASRLALESLDMQRQASRADDQVQAAEKARQAVWMRLQLEKKRMGLQFELIDAGRVAPPGASKKVVLTALAIIVFLLTLPLAMLGVGAVDDRVYELEDVQRLGMATIGMLPRFGGDNRGALEERLRSERNRQKSSPTATAKDNG